MTSTDNTNELYTVVGGGAIGGTLAVHLALAGHDVQIVDTDAAHVNAIRENGLTIERPDGPLNARIPAYTLAEIPELAESDGADDGNARRLGVVLLAVKAQATANAMEWISPRLAADGCVASMQNGLNEALIAEFVGVERTVTAFVDLFADVLEPGVIKDGGIGTIALGEYAGGTSDRVRRLAEDLSHWGAPIVSDNVAGFLWAKLAFGAMLTATSLVDEDMAIVVDEHRPPMLALAREVYAVSDALGISLEGFDAFDPDDYRTDAPPDATDAAFSRLSTWLAGQTKTRSGIWRDLNVRKRPTEVPTQYEPIISMAREHGIDTPKLRVLVDLIRELERGDSVMGQELMARLERA